MQWRFQRHTDVPELQLCPRHSAENTVFKLFYLFRSDEPLPQHSHRTFCSTPSGESLIHFIMSHTDLSFSSSCHYIKSKPKHYYKIFISWCFVAWKFSREPMSLEDEAVFHNQDPALTQSICMLWVSFNVTLY